MDMPELALFLLMTDINVHFFNFLLNYFHKMQNLLLASRKGSLNIINRLFATVKNLGVDIKSTDTLVRLFIIQGKQTHRT